MNTMKLLKIAVGVKVLMTLALVAWTITLYTNEQETPLTEGRILAKSLLFQRTLQQISNPWTNQWGYLAE